MLLAGEKEVMIKYISHYLSRMFKKVTGMTPNSCDIPLYRKYIRTRRRPKHKTRT